LATRASTSGRYTLASEAKTAAALENLTIDT
jgi:hypothetical protein